MNPTRRVRKARGGNAPLELVLFLPLVVVMLAGMITTTQVSVTDAKAATTARHVAFQARRSPYRSGPLHRASATGVGLAAIDDILGPAPGVRPDGGLLVSGVQLPITPLFERWKGHLPAARSVSAVVGDSWDHQRIEFRRHPRLSLSEKINYFGGGRLGNLSAFESILGGGFGTGSFGSLPGSRSAAKSGGDRGFWEGFKDGVGGNLGNKWTGIKNAFKDPIGTTKDLARGVGHVVANPITTAKQIGGAIGQTATDAYVAYKTGDNGNLGEILGNVTTEVIIGAVGTKGLDKVGKVAKVKWTAATNDPPLPNIVTPERAKHILTGDATGGGHKFGVKRLFNGKSKFPATWGSNKILNAVSEVATNPRSTWFQQTGKPGAKFTKKGAPVKYRVDGVYEGMRIRVIVQGGEIVTAFPIQ